MSDTAREGVRVGPSRYESIINISTGSGGEWGGGRAVNTEKKLEWAVRGYMGL